MLCESLPELESARGFQPFLGNPVIHDADVQVEKWGWDARIQFSLPADLLPNSELMHRSRCVGFASLLLPVLQDEIASPQCACLLHLDVLAHCTT